ncbi:hypothetical protein BURPS406E_G0427 [Burkholderia pseudomallei 406e]|uniref:Uncharacterized protein n=2 Tax=Burkholderia pseudomallei TaxID=28450 RepID=A0A0E1VT17_BURPE|nr:hypothetical protein BURPS668_A1357 [Burkholderia pseudomallei 668]ABN95680.1 hypothetical protein BURPS1106A_A1279 [Burkholderia pseudomallei 1106a]AFR19223.1 hypothetical protein BPC006_II1295 [Burkholderia pseudomallei BPC006]EDO87308.1 hypothetical protein BURPS406E_G0427 [Burkholderia pseudomallei 406e]EEH26198.1 conserved hypothetical protein [Burkholderia pseudomallei Pakistan 9]EES23625.1 hypothetical protein BURPS1106B_0709 [Burkholderia pseudomallei 1106b]EET04003.1 hypothetical 
MGSRRFGGQSPVLRPRFRKLEAPQAMRRHAAARPPTAGVFGR